MENCYKERLGNFRVVKMPLDTCNQDGSIEAEMKLLYTFLIIVKILKDRLWKIVQSRGWVISEL
jgi:hypothetical protein